VQRLGGGQSQPEGAQGPIWSSSDPLVVLAIKTCDPGFQLSEETN
jgi:hypothetical protein